MFGNDAQDGQSQNGAVAQPYGGAFNAPPLESTPFGAPAAPAGATNDAPVANTPTASDAAAVGGFGADDDLLAIKQDALQALSPLVSHLEQSPEEKFRTTMMMIQAADNQALIKDAYEAAQQITDDKARAQALLDVVNEINYFTQHSQN